MSDVTHPIPDISEAQMRLRWSAIFFLTMYAFMMVKASWLSDPDVYWHIVIGRDIWQSGSLPHHDQYSHTMTGAPWIAKEWLSQVFLYVIYAQLGWSGVAVFACSVCALSLTILFWRFLSLVKWTVAVGLVWIAMPFLSLSLLARPQIFSFLLFAISIIAIEQAVHERRRPAIFMVGLSVLWANLHASFPILLVLIVIGACEAVMRAQASERIRLARDWLMLIIAIIVSFGVTPYGFASFKVATTIVGADLSKYILEWRPIDWSYDRSTKTEALILGGWLSFLVFGSIALVWRWRYWPLRLVPVFLFAAMTVKHIRFCSMMTLSAAIAVARPIGHRFPRFAPQDLGGDRHTVRNWKIAFALSLVLFGATFTFVDKAPDASISPRAALEFARHLKIEGRVYNSYVFGGFLISENVPTLIDGRTELYFGGTLERILDPIIANDQEGFKRSLTQYKADWAFVRTGSSEAKLFAHLSDWSEVYSDKTAQIFVRKL